MYYILFLQNGEWHKIINAWFYDLTGDMLFLAMGLWIVICSSYMDINYETLSAP